ncbi:MAG: LysM peptidoglycan-binding domain-containing protein [Proteobacteria bacterium]|nr:MAG: LysM peptidoglycan-binding domain-containing protein [Pseudomonadota bacterium]
MQMGHGHWGLLVLALSLSGCVALQPTQTEALQTRVPEPEMQTPLPEALAIADLELMAAPGEVCSPDVHLHLSEGIEWNLWDRVRGGFSLPFEANSRIDVERQWYTKNQAYLDRVAERAEPYLHFIVSELELRNMPAELALLPIVESAFQPFAYSAGRAAGIWQFIPSTGRIFDLDQNWWYDGRRDIVASTNAALDYLEKLTGYFDGDWMLALAAYNSGSGTVRKAIRKNRARNKATDFWSLDLPKETRTYVPRLLALRDLVADPEAYGMVLQPITDQRYFRMVDLDSQIDLAMAAELAELPIEEIYRLNPGFNRWATAPEGPHRLVLPLEAADRFEDELANVPQEERVTWKRHRVKSGETLGQIARNNRTTVAVLQRVNSLRGHIIRAGHHLLIPVASRASASYTLSADQRLKSIQSTPRGSNKVVHTVAAGDTLWDISRSYQVSVSALARWNGMAPRDPLKPGQKLVIWQQSGLQKTAQSTPNHEGRIQRVNYTVRRGDSLARIAQRFRVSVSKLQQWNGIKKGAYLQPGQRLTLFVDVTRQSGSA